MRIPEPVAPDTWKPARSVVKIASPTALEMTLGGIVTMTRFLGFSFVGSITLSVDSVALGSVEVGSEVPAGSAYTPFSAPE
jgi:hypothetical protein